MRVMALDHGAARTGVAVSDATGTLATPLTVVDRVDGDAGFARLLELIAERAPEAIVVGLPVSLDGREHGQAARARAFARRLAAATDVPVTTYDERFSTKVAAQRGGRAPEDARGAAVILEDFLRAQASRAAEPAAGESSAAEPGADDV
jgi:putative Holliday junction resolvase